MADFNRINTKIEKVGDGFDFSSIKNDFEYILVTHTDRVEFISAKDADAEQIKQNLIELRAFNEDKELHIVIQNGHIKGRIRTDGEGDETDVYDGNYLVWGKSVDGDKRRLHDDRGIDISVPFDVDESKRVFLKIRSYAKTDGASLNFVDYRIFGVEVKEATEWQSL